MAQSSIESQLENLRHMLRRGNPYQEVSEVVSEITGFQIIESSQFEMKYEYFYKNEKKGLNQ